MTVEIISIGTELLLGEITNTNAQYLASQIAALGLPSYFQTVVGDNPTRLKETIKNSLNRNSILILTGGLGPTYDDLSKEIVADVLNKKLVLHKPSLKEIEDYFSIKNETMPKSNIKQAMIPEGSIVLKNNHGTAPGLVVETDEKMIVLLPGPPHEMKPMFENELYPYLLKFTKDTIVSSHLYLFGIGESALEEKLSSMMKEYTNPTIAPYASDGTLMIRLTAKAASNKEAQQLINPVLEKISKQFDSYVFSVDEPRLENVLVKLLKDNNKTLTTAESCTGGLLGELITSVPGASNIYQYGFITYSNQAKEDLLDVKPQTLKEYGAVSKETVIEMALNSRERSKSDYALSISGLAGPDGGSPNKPIGLVYIGLATPNNVYTKKLNLGRNRPNERNYIRQYSVMHAMKLLIDVIKENKNEYNEN